MPRFAKPGSFWPAAWIAQNGAHGEYADAIHPQNRLQLGDAAAERVCLAAPIACGPPLAHLVCPCPVVVCPCAQPGLNRLNVMKRQQITTSPNTNFLYFLLLLQCPAGFHFTGGSMPKKRKKSGHLGHRVRPLFYAHNFVKYHVTLSRGWMHENVTFCDIWRCFLLRTFYLLVISIDQGPDASTISINVSLGTTTVPS